MPSTIVSTAVTVTVGVFQFVSSNVRLMGVPAPAPRLIWAVGVCERDRVDGLRVSGWCSYRSRAFDNCGLEASQRCRYRRWFGGVVRRAGHSRRSERHLDVRVLVVKSFTGC
jgi:hypothetical protein